ncbi:hypothetical protein RND81_06G053700 [Saponaria officinalis]|uniref:1-phosphatidylinositol-4-phosphate 5-kinase n=1 Tax=Saponaria officinalis TaxID=3572 RepID=A0AAW1K6J4_SAPOF
MVETSSETTFTTKTTQNRSRSRVTPTPNTDENDVVSVEKHLKNGDLYIGKLSNKIPEGVGKYLKNDGCMYEGEWSKGKANGKGKLSFPSGATYEGEFTAGKIEGQGVFTGSNGETYKGQWLSGRKHGHGEMWYENGDYYVGGWKNGVKDGCGKYFWKGKMGNFFQGEWRNGVILRKCMLGRVNGGRFEEGFSGRLFEGQNGDFVCDFGGEIEGVEVVFGGDCDLGFDEKFCSFGSNDGKKFGEIVCKGHRNYDLIVCFQIGLRYSVEKYSSISRELTSNDFDPLAKLWTRFPPEGSKLTPTHKSTEFRWKDYCPVVFMHLRDLFQIEATEYMSAICGNDALRELSSPGKSGSCFFLTQDDKFMIKTVRKSEVKVLLRMLQGYFQHVYRYENSLLTKFYGVHCVKPIGGPKTRFIVMGNLFCSEHRIHRRFDLKGSRYGRTIDKTEGEIDETTTLKDLDLDFLFRLQKNWHQELIMQIERDCEFLEAEKIMDYSLLVGIHFRNDFTEDKMQLSPLHGNTATYQNDKYLYWQRFLDPELHDIDHVLACRKSLNRIGANVPARAERLARSDFDQYILGDNDDLTPSRNSEIYEVILYMGIIDILQDYDVTKMLEHVYKSLHANPTSISAVDPKLYSRRFRDFIWKIFVDDK